MKIKIAVIALTFVTVTAFMVFLALFFKQTVSGFKQDNAEESPVLLLAGKLQDEGLLPEALRQYEKFLDTGKPGAATRARITRLIGEIHTRNGDCRAALVWLLQSELADAEDARRNGVGEKIEHCRRIIKAAGNGELGSKN